MTPIRDHRTHGRIPCQAHLELECITCRMPQIVEAELYNMSDEGLYIEAESKLDKGEKFLIHDVCEAPGTEECKPLKGDAGIVRWARPLERGRHLFYGFGVKLFYPDLEQGFEWIMDLAYSCDMCGMPLDLNDLKQQKGPLWLCPRCNEHAEHLPDLLNDEVDRFLVGNAL